MFAYCGNNPVNRVDPWGYIDEAVELGGYGYAVPIPDFEEFLKSILLLLGLYGGTQAVLSDRGEPESNKTEKRIQAGLDSSIASPPGPGNNRNRNTNNRNWQRVEDKYLKDQLKKQGTNPHEIKYEYMGKKASISRYDILIDKNSGQLAIYDKILRIIVDITDYYIMW